MADDATLENAVRRANGVEPRFTTSCCALSHWHPVCGCSRNNLYQALAEEPDSVNDLDPRFARSEESERANSNVGPRVLRSGGAAAPSSMEGHIMLCSIRELQGFGIEATDGSIGRVHEMLFDDDRWVIRYLVVDTGKWLPGRKVLISPISVESIDGLHRRVVLHLDKDRIRNSPDIYADQPVSRQKEATFNMYYGYGPYWAGPAVWGPAVYPGELRPTTAHTAWPGAEDGAQTPTGDPHLRSTREIIGYHIAASDGEIGHVDDFVIDDGRWTVRYIVVDTSNWPGGRSVLLSPATVRSIDWSRRKVHVDAPAERIRTGPEYRAVSR